VRAELGLLRLAKRSP